MRDFLQDVVAAIDELTGPGITVPHMVRTKAKMVLAEAQAKLQAAMDEDVATPAPSTPDTEDAVTRRLKGCSDCIKYRGEGQLCDFHQLKIDRATATPCHEAGERGWGLVEDAEKTWHAAKDVTPAQENRGPEPRPLPSWEPPAAEKALTEVCAEDRELWVRFVSDQLCAGRGDVEQIDTIARGLVERAP